MVQVVGSTTQGTSNEGSSTTYITSDHSLCCGGASESRHRRVIEETSESTSSTLSNKRSASGQVQAAGTAVETSEQVALSSKSLEALELERYHDEIDHLQNKITKLINFFNRSILQDNTRSTSQDSIQCVSKGETRVDTEVMKSIEGSEAAERSHSKKYDALSEENTRKQFQTVIHSIESALKKPLISKEHHPDTEAEKTCESTSTHHETSSNVKTNLHQSTKDHVTLETSNSKW